MMTTPIDSSHRYLRLGPECAKGSISQVLFQIPKAYPFAQVSQNIELCLHEEQLANLQGNASIFSPTSVKFEKLRKHLPSSLQYRQFVTLHLLGTHSVLSKEKPMRHCRQMEEFVQI